VVASPSVPAGEELLKTGKVDVFAANKANLFDLSDKMPGSRVLDGRMVWTKSPSLSRRAARPEWPMWESTSMTRNPKD